jgi:hypothetical protein
MAEDAEGTLIMVKTGMDEIKVYEWAMENKDKDPRMNGIYPSGGDFDYSIFLLTKDLEKVRQYEEALRSVDPAVQVKVFGV